MDLIWMELRTTVKKTEMSQYQFANFENSSGMIRTGHEGSRLVCLCVCLSVCLSDPQSDSESPYRSDPFHIDWR